MERGHEQVGLAAAVHNPDIVGAGAQHLAHAAQPAPVQLVDCQSLNVVDVIEPLLGGRALTVGNLD